MEYDLTKEEEVKQWASNSSFEKNEYDAHTARYIAYAVRILIAFERESSFPSKNRSVQYFIDHVRHGTVLP